MKSEKKYCVNCGTTLTGRQQLYCSEECRTEFTKIELYESILQGQSDWRLLWPAKRLEILERDHFTCHVCSVHGNSMTLEVHHIKPVSQGGECLDGANLITLCHDCHKLTFNRFHNYIGIPEPKKQLKLAEFVQSHTD